MGISSAGVDDPRTGITYANELMPGGGGTAPRFCVTSEFGLPCSLLNDVHRSRSGRGSPCCWPKIAFLTVTVGTGIGGAL